MVGAGLAVLALVLLLVRSHQDPWRATSLAVYGGTLILLYTASALYHSLRVGRKAETVLYGLDRAAIYALIAGTYTPICLIALPPAWGWTLFGVSWGVAAAGWIIDFIARYKTPDWLQAVLYLISGWVFLVAICPLAAGLPTGALAWLLAGSALYTVGAVICVKDRPRLKPGVFGAHELWHVLVILASVCHFIVMFHYLARPS